MCCTNSQIGQRFLFSIFFNQKGSKTKIYLENAVTVQRNTMFSVFYKENTKLNISVQFIEFLTEFCFVRKKKLRCVPCVQKNFQKP